MKKLNTVIFAIALAATTVSIPALASTPEIRIDSVRHVVILPAIEGGADVAVSMIDRRISAPDTVTTIASQLLLQSDLRGHVEDAAWYLRAPAEEALPAADALMLTQGWTRYDIPAVIAGTINDSLPYPIEIGAQLDGVIRSKWRGKPLAGASANIIAPKLDFATAAITDLTGHFSMVGFEWPDSTLFIISAWNSKGKNEENIELISEQFPALTTFPISSEISISSNQGNDPAVLHRLDRSSQRIMVSLNEVIVTNTEPLKLNNIIATITSANFYPGKDPRITSYEQAFRNIPGLNIEGEWVHYRGRPLSIWVDGKYAGITSPHYHEKISNASSGAINESEIMTRALPLTDLEGFYPYMENRSVSYITPTLSSLFNHGYSKGGVLYITTKHYGKSKNKLSDNLRAIQPLGYQKPREFYVPSSPLNEIGNYDRGSVINWYPFVSMSQEIELNIPSYLTSEDIIIWIEGVTTSGDIIRIN